MHLICASWPCVITAQHRDMLKDHHGGNNAEQHSDGVAACPGYFVCVPDLLHIIFSLSSSSSCQARSSLFCQCLALYLEKGTGTPWGVGKKGSSLCAPGETQRASAHGLQYNLLLQSPCFSPDCLETIIQSTTEELKNCPWSHKDVFY